MASSLLQLLKYLAIIFGQALEVYEGSSYQEMKSLVNQTASKPAENRQVRQKIPRVYIMKQTNILFVDDDKTIRAYFCKIVKGLMTCRVKTAADGLDALKLLKTFKAHIVITDLMMPRMDGITLLKKIKALYPKIFVIILTGHSSVDNTVQAMKFGAYDYLQKPLAAETVKSILKETVGHKTLLTLQEEHSNERRKKHRFENIIGQDRKMYAIYNRIERVAPIPVPVLITGESGTGKELVADALHHRSPRAEKPLKKVNCAAFTETLFNSELFGHEMGAFTGACKQKTGLFESACDGTLFLDEIGEMSPVIQASLLRAIESGAFCRVGGEQTIEVNIRILCATNKNLTELIAKKRFRNDLYYRINVTSIDVPPLRKRKTDIPLLVNHFVKQSCDEFNINKKCTVSRAAMRLMTEYDWPGNIRELVNAVKNAIIFCTDSHIKPSDLPSAITTYEPEKSFELKFRSNSLSAAEKALIRRALNENNYNFRRTAADLEIARSTLYSKMKKHGISR